MILITRAWILAWVGIHTAILVGVFLYSGQIVLALIFLFVWAPISLALKLAAL